MGKRWGSQPVEPAVKAGDWRESCRGADQFDFKRIDAQNLRGDGLSAGQRDRQIARSSTAVCSNNISFLARHQILSQWECLW
ncbi:MAG: hypothetical protein ACP5D7_14425 [Limnospira sp.]